MQNNVTKSPRGGGHKDFLGLKGLFPSHTGIILILFLSLVCRVYFIRTMEPPGLQPDSETYIRMAKNIAYHGTLSNQNPDIKNPTPSAYVMPGYPIFLSLFFRVSGNEERLLQLVRIIQLMLGLVMILFVYLVGIELEGKRFGIIAALIAALYPSNWFTGFHILTESLFTVFVIIFLYLLLRALRRGKWQDYLAAGSALMISTFTRPTPLPVAFLAIIYIIVLYRGNWKRILLCVLNLILPLFVAMSIWTVRNAVQFGHFIPLTTSSNNPRVLGLYPEGEYPKLWKESGLSEYEYNRLWGRWAKRLLREKLDKGMPSFLKSQIYPHFRAFASLPYGLRELEGWESLGWRRAKWFLGYHRHLFWISLAGLILYSFRSPRVILFWGYLAGLGAVHMICIARSRYGYPWMAVLLIFGGYAGSELIRALLFLKRERKRRAFIGLSVSVLILPLLLHFRSNGGILSALRILGIIVFLGLFFHLVWVFFQHTERSIKAGIKKGGKAGLLLGIICLNLLDNSGHFRTWNLVTERAHSWGYLFSEKDYIEHIIDLPDEMRKYEKYYLLLKVKRRSMGETEFALAIYLNKKLHKVIGPDEEIPEENLMVPLDASLLKKQSRLNVLLNLKGKVDPAHCLLVRLRLDQFKGISRFRGQGNDLSYKEGEQKGTYQVSILGVRFKNGKKEVKNWLGSPRKSQGDIE